MKSCIKIILLIAVILSLTGCSSSYEETSNKIASPENKAFPIQGKWIVEQTPSHEAVKNLADTDMDWAGRVFDFNYDSISFDGLKWDDVNYKIRRVNADEYFLHKYAGAIGDFGIKNKEIQVITASSQDKYLYEFIRIDENRLIADIDSKLYHLRKAPEGYTADKKGNANAGDSTIIVSFSESAYINSGLLLGIRTPEQINQKGTDKTLEQYVYKTYWISFSNGNVGSLYQADDIFLPRKDGFWKLGVQQILGEEGIEDVLSAKRVFENNKKRSEEPKASKKSLRIETKMRRTILYVGNDYICTENIEELKKAETNELVEKKVLRTMPVDNMSNIDGIKLSDLAGDNGNIAMEGAITGLLGSSNSNIKNVVEEDQEKNFALFRKMGHWFFKGRMGLETGEPMSYVDFNINLIPPANMVAYDMLHVPWTNIKDKVPLAVDAYTSPNNDMAIVITRNKVMVFSINEGNLGEEPVRTFAIPDGSAVIMAEWATGDYVLNWEKSFVVNNKAEAIK